jgi:hypothetical protein
MYVLLNFAWDENKNQADCYNIVQKDRYVA